MAAWPALRPLVLVLKAYLRAESLHELNAGGLSGYGLTYMVLAHLMVCALQPQYTPPSPLV